MVKSKKILFLLLSMACVGTMLLSGCSKEKDKGKENVGGSQKENEANPLEKEGYVLDWHDEFDGTELNAEYWLPQYLPHQTKSYAGAQAKYEIGDGVLKLYIDEDSVDFYTGEEGGFRVSSIQTYGKNGLHIGDTLTTVAPFNGYATQYGYFEMRAKMPSCGGGGHVAWWLIGTEYDADEDGEGSTQNCEIDIVETLYDGPNTAWPKVHAWDDSDIFTWTDNPVLLEEGVDYVNEWHTYAMDWTPEGLVFYVDDKEIARTKQSPQYEMCMFLSMYANDAESFWSGTDNGVYPKEWEIDYVRVYKDVNGYPNAQTKPKEPASSTVKIDSQAYLNGGDPVAESGITDLAREAELTTTAETAKSLAPEDVKYIIRPDFDMIYGWCSSDKTNFPEEFTFTWSSPQNIDTVDMYTHYAVGQGATEIELQIQKEGGEWTTAAEYKIKWLLNNETVEYARMAVPDGEGITGLKMIVKDANLEWKHYVIQRVHIYKSNN